MKHLAQCPCPNCRLSGSGFPASDIGLRSRMVLGLGQDDDEDTGGDEAPDSADEGSDESDDDQSSTAVASNDEQDEAEEEDDEGNGINWSKLLSQGAQLTATGAKLLSSQKAGAASSASASAPASGSVASANPLSKVASLLGTTPTNLALAAGGLAALYLIVGRSRK